ncbi:molybdenum cofactor sulfurylase [Rhizobium sp. RU20A]|uniref:xanthine dehydrogenase accessory protein XdhC n=1 Tax=Rhizobium sp. RU20A TaxID=1907412 RepID=UPI000953FB73|nr:xanthine dehydrogenase accessory protein XdhC [Rhizobium sp. RU20A]SIQ28810.1 molybdenum cofactor sulfurylase [Rhizobium sp. RU20A]
MPDPVTPLATFLATHTALVHVTIAVAKGSTPREAGAFMLVSKTATFGTIGGGQLEFMAIDHARRMLSGEILADRLDIPLGPEIGQCCGGRTELAFTDCDSALRETLVMQESEERAVCPQAWLFGAGHVGKALAAALAPLPLSVMVVETRPEELKDLPPGTTAIATPLPEAEIDRAAPGAAIVILTHDHALDFMIATRALSRTDLAYVGMIGSKSKRATFAHAFTAEGGDPAAFQRLTLPIGGTVVRDKRPAVIAALTAAEILTAFAAYPRGTLSGR